MSLTQVSFAKLAATMLVATLFSGCVTNQNKQTRYWEPDQSWYSSASNQLRQLKGADNQIVSIPADYARNIYDSKTRVEGVANLSIPIRLVIVDSYEVNAFAFVKDEQKFVGFTLGYIYKFGGDINVVGVTMGHEVSHHLLQHTDGRRKNREEKTNTASRILGSIANQIVPFSGYALSFAITGIGRSFTRDEERAADERGLELAHIAGFDICRGLKLWDQSRAGADISALLSTHPSGPERLENLNQLSLKIHGKRC